MVYFHKEFQICGSPQDIIFIWGEGMGEMNINRLYQSLANLVGVISTHFVHCFQIP